MEVRKFRQSGQESSVTILLMALVLATCVLPLSAQYKASPGMIYATHYSRNEPNAKLRDISVTFRAFADDGILVMEGCADTKFAVSDNAKGIWLMTVADDTSDGLFCGTGWTLPKTKTSAITIRARRATIDVAEFQGGVVILRGPSLPLPEKLWRGKPDEDFWFNLFRPHGGKR